MKRSPRLVVLATISLICVGLIITRGPAPAPALAEDKMASTPQP